MPCTNGVAPWEEVQREAEHEHEVRMYRARVMGVDPAELGLGPGPGLQVDVRHPDMRRHMQQMQRMYGQVEGQVDYEAGRLL